MTRLISAWVLLGALSALAQTTVTPQVAFRRVDDANADTFTFGAGQCADSVTVAWSNTTAIQFASNCSSNAMKVWATTTECGDAPGTSDKRYADISGLVLQQTKSGSFTVKLSELPGFDSALTTDGGVVACGSNDVSLTHRICGSIVYTPFTGTLCGTSQTYSASPLELVYDTQAPTIPSITAAAPQDSAVKVTFSVDSDTSVVLLEARAQGEVEFKQIASGSALSTTTIIGKGLVNNTTYDVRIRAQDAAGNVSGPSELASVTPIKTLGFYGFYVRAGGTDGGCSAAPGLLSLLGVAWFMRRRHLRHGSRS